VSSRELAKLCDPSRLTKEAALNAARHSAASEDDLHLQVGRLLKEQCYSSRPNFAVISRALEILDVVAPGCVFSSVLRPVLRNCDPQVLSKCALMIAKREDNLDWAERFLGHEDPRLRANIVEGLWENRGPAVHRLYIRAARDFHHRVVGNAAYGLHLIAAPEFLPVLESMQQNPKPMFRSAASWVIRKIGDPEMRSLLKPLIQDENTDVRRGAFRTLAVLNAKATARAGESLNHTAEAADAIALAS
jgi:hypothetical protein